MSVATGEPVMELVCSSCGAPFTHDDLDLRHGVANCRYCHAVTSLQTAQTAAAVAAPAVPAAAVDRLVPQPDSVHIDEWANELVITRRWFTPVLIFLAFFCVAWDSFLVFWYWMGFTHGADMGPMRIIMFVFPICHVAVGVGLTYATLCGFFNRTVIQVNRLELTVRHGPIPCPGNRTLSVDTIRQLFTQIGTSPNNNQPQQSFEVKVLLTDGRSLKLLGTLPDAQQAEFIRQKIEQFLNLEHQPVAGEIATTS